MRFTRPAREKRGLLGDAGCHRRKMARRKRTNRTAKRTTGKMIVRSNGTVTYVGKDIAYQLWKFGLLGKDFYYEPFLTYPDGRTLWATAARAAHPTLRRLDADTRYINVIDSRQAYLQNVVVAGLRALGFKRRQIAPSIFRTKWWR